MSLRARAVVFVVAGLLLAAGGQTLAAPRIVVLAMSPGAHPFERFGHAALLVDETGHDGDLARVYNYGTFDGDDPKLVPKFLYRKLPFWLSVATWGDVKRAYAKRRITLLELALTDAEARKLSDKMARNAEPANAFYVYDFFTDNCSTRVRDAVASVVPELESARLRPAHATLRGHVRDVLRPVPLFRRAIDLALNEEVDAPSTRSDDAFLPRELASLLEETRREGGRPLVARATTWTGPAFRDLTRPASPWIELAWLALLAPLAVGALDHGRHAATRVVTGVGLAVWGLAGGLVGAALAVTSSTPYPIARWNGNLLALSPLLLVLVPYGVRLALGRVGEHGRARLRILLGVLLAPIVIDLGRHVVGWARHGHVELLVFVACGHLLALAALRETPAAEGVGVVVDEPFPVEAA